MSLIAPTAATALAAPSRVATHVSTPAAAGAATPDSAPPSPAAERGETRERLLWLADTVTAVPADTGRGYAYHHQRRWILESTGRPAHRPDTPAVFGSEFRRWEANDGSGRGIDVETGPDYALAGAYPDHRSTDVEFAGGHTKHTDYPPGHRRSTIIGPLASDRVGLARQLRTDPQVRGPQDMLWAISEMFGAFYVAAPVRRAALRVLADLDGLTHREHVTDRLGRTGIAVFATSDAITATLLFDPATGLLLASELRSVGAHERLDVPPNLIRVHTLFIEQSRTELGEVGGWGRPS